LLHLLTAGFGTNLPKLVGPSMSALPGNSDINLFCYGQGVIDLDAEVSDGAFDFGMAEQKLHGPQVAGAPVDQGRFGPSERMGTEEVRVQPDAGNPRGDEPGVLPRRHAPSLTASADKQGFTRFLASNSYVVIHRLSGLLGQFEPDGLPGLLLPHRRPID
jgi:hypothetical protein